MQCPTNTTVELYDAPVAAVEECPADGWAPAPRTSTCRHPAPQCPAACWCGPTLCCAAPDPSLRATRWRINGRACADVIIGGSISHVWRCAWSQLCNNRLHAGPLTLRQASSCMLPLQKRRLTQGGMMKRVDGRRHQQRAAGAAQQRRLRPQGGRVQRVGRRHNHTRRADLWWLASGLLLLSRRCSCMYAIAAEELRPCCLAVV